MHGETIKVILLVFALS